MREIGNQIRVIEKLAGVAVLDRCSPIADRFVPDIWYLIHDIRRPHLTSLRDGKCLS
jgi:hypothetical protein